MSTITVSIRQLAASPGDLLLVVFVFDVSDLRTVAHRIAAHADAARKQADTLQRAATDARWQSIAAEAFRHETDGIAADLRRAAQKLDDAAAAALRHAAAVERALDLLAAGIGVAVDAWGNAMGELVEVSEAVGSSLVRTGGAVLDAVSFW